MNTRPFSLDQPWWQQFFVAVRSPAALVVVATVISLGLLLALHQVVLGAVRQGELRRMAVAKQAEDSWRCGAMRNVSLRDGCRSQLGSPSRAEVPLNIQNAAMLTTGARTSR